MPDPDDLQRLRRLLDSQPVAALGTLHRGEPAASMVPFVLRPADGDLKDGSSSAIGGVFRSVAAAVDRRLRVNGPCAKPSG